LGFGNAVGRGRGRGEKEGRDEVNTLPLREGQPEYKQTDRWSQNVRCKKGVHWHQAYYGSRVIYLPFVRVGGLGLESALKVCS